MDRRGAGTKELRVDRAFQAPIDKTGCWALGLSVNPCLCSLVPQKCSFTGGGGGWKDWGHLQWPQSDGGHSNLTPDHVQAFVKRMLPMQTQRGVG